MSTPENDGRTSWGTPQQPQTPSWGQQPPQGPPPGWGQQPPVQKKKRGKGGCLGCAGVLAVIVVIAVAAGAGKSSSGSKTAAPAALPAAQAPAAQAPAVQQPTAQAPAAQAPPPAAPAVVLQASGSGIKNTAQFTVGDQWTLAYTVDCSTFGQSGNFIVSDESGMPLVNELKDKDSGSSPQYNAGTHHLEINSECAWTVTVTNG
ncbi:hypothetical protein P3T36_005211 [Kitasatospora sp. MAP12-15]|uniref:hypothetical protein n=1 Tax=unclassified Kitasatospora TaxID=2633591 RepID=UPI002476E56B|nr:hypothetical protein [Kitasatospora sp. MAP12-44]MDH6113626.1 hypothetical protein [Kitasatospora sp. MAP12-44]